MQDLVEQLSIQLELRNWKIAVAESCTGGILAAALTRRPGSSRIFDRGYVTYSNAAKTQCLNVPPETLEQYGAVSAQTAEAMARGALQNSQAQLCVSITGIAGPDGGSNTKPVGLVYIGFAAQDGIIGSTENNFEGSREQIRAQAATSALKQLIATLTKAKSE